ncbi:MAG: class I SAM-dependent methyltransferase [Actinomycetota bacterium]
MEAAEFWSIGDYATVGDLWSAPGRVLAQSLTVAGLDVIDLATGTGVTAIAMAGRGARSVVGVDAAPKLLAEAGRRATRAGVDVDWVEADLAHVPLPDRSADVVVSTFGLIFAEDPAAALAECHRLTRPGGRIVFTSWSATGLFGRIRHVMSAYFPDAPEPWHERPDDIRAVAGPSCDVVERSFTMTVASPEAFVDQLERHSAPFVLAVQTLGERWADARDDLVDVVAAVGGRSNGDHRVEVGYLVATVAVP